MFLRELLLYSFSTNAILQTIQSFVTLVHVVHVVITGIMEDVELRIFAKHRLQSILHGEDATDDHGAASLDIGLASEYLRKSFHHSLGDTLVLQSA